MGQGNSEQLGLDGLLEGKSVSPFQRSQLEVLEKAIQEQHIDNMRKAFGVLISEAAHSDEVESIQASEGMQAHIALNIAIILLERSNLLDTVRIDAANKVRANLNWMTRIPPLLVELASPLFSRRTNLSTM